MKSSQDRIQAWFAQKSWEPHAFQRDTWKAYAHGKSGLVNAPTGSGKTYSLLVPIVKAYMDEYPETWQQSPKKHRLRAIWITPIRALSKEIELSANRLIEALELPWKVGVRTGDTSTKERTKMMAEMPELLITTSESLHLLLASKKGRSHFKSLQTIVCDEWHELMGSKRGVLMELALSRLRGINPKLQIWGISATIGNMQQALEVLLGSPERAEQAVLIKSQLEKRIEIKSILPDEVEKMPWAGHLGIKLLQKVVPVIHESESTLIFTNTRSQCEIWYQRLLDASPDLAGQIAMHHGSISKELREWVEDALHSGKIKAVVCTSSLDLGVDFRPVNTIVQIGGPKGIARFAQRAGRSGHQPGALSTIYFVPTHSLELVEAAALREALKRGEVEERVPYIRSFDVLVQYLTTLAVGGGFQPEDIYPEIQQTHCFSSISQEEWNWCLAFITSGGQSLNTYDEFHKVEVLEDGLYKVNSRRIALRHRMQIGTIVSDPAISIKIKRGPFLGTVEESFISKFNEGDVFWFSGQSLQFIRLKDMVAEVLPSTKKTGKIPAWGGGRMPLSSNLGEMLRVKLNELASQQSFEDIELETIQPLIQVQKERSAVPAKDELLIEFFESKDGFHLLMYPYEGRAVHEGVSALLAYRISQLYPVSFSLAFNDYGFELLSDQPLALDAILDNNLISVDHLLDDIQNSVNASEMARRRFREIAGISGLVFKGYPGKQKRDKHVQASARLFFDVFRDYEPSNLLFKEAYDEVLDFQLEFVRMRNALLRMQEQKKVIQKPDLPTPFAFPIMVDRLRETFVAEKLEDRISKMQIDFG